MYIRVVNGRRKKPRQGTRNELNMASMATGRAIQYINSIRRENPAIKPVKQPALFCLISISS
jgi:hypothetical protein